MFDASTAITAAADTVCFMDLSVGGDGSLWMLATVVPIGFYSALSIVSNAVDCYNFVVVWNRISQAHRIDLERIHDKKNRVIKRRMKMEKVLTKRPYGDVFFPKEASCPVCLLEFERADRVVFHKDKHKCAHLFHEDCLTAWLQTHSSCPCCRYEMLPLAPPPQATTPILVSY